MILIRLAVGGFAVLCCYLSGLEISNRTQGNLIPAEDPVDSTLALAAEGRWAEVRMMSELIAEQPQLGDPDQAAELTVRADAELSSFWGQAERFAQGAITGEPTDLTSMLGSLSLDLFVIGDIRDLAVQGWKEANYGTGDQLILALSAIGLSTTLAPQVDWAPALLKAFRKTGALTERFTKSLTKASTEAISSGQYARLSAIVTDMGKAAQRLGPGPLRGVMRSVDSVEDLSKIASAAKIDPRGTYALTRLFGKDGVKWIKQDGTNVGALVTAIKTGSRLTKAVQKSTRAVPTAWLYVIFAIAAIVLTLTALPRRRHGSTRKGARGLFSHKSF